MQEVHGKECEGRFLGVKLDEYSAPARADARQDRRDVDMQQGTAMSRAGQQGLAAGAGLARVDR